MFRIGEKVVCVEGGVLNPRWGGKHPPKTNEIYHIRALGETIDCKSGVGVLLREIKNGIQRDSGLEYGFASSRFRPLVSKSTKKSRQKIIDAKLGKFLDMKQPEKV